MRWCALRWCACARRCAREWHAVRLAPRAGAPRLRVQGPSSSLHRPRSPAQMYIEVLELPCGYLRSVHAEITCLNPCKLLCATFPPRQVLPCHPKHRHHCRPAPCRPSEEARRRLVLLLLLAARRRRAQRPSSHSGAQRRRVPHHPSLVRESVVGLWRDERFTDFRGSVRRLRRGPGRRLEFKADRMALASSSKYFLNLS